MCEDGCAKRVEFGFGESLQKSDLVGTVWWDEKGKKNWQRGTGDSCGWESSRAGLVGGGTGVTERGRASQFRIGWPALSRGGGGPKI